MTMELSEDKKQLIQRFGDMLTDDSDNILRIQGGAGCGKTTVIEALVRHYLMTNQLLRAIDLDTKELTSDNIFLTATTNKATAVIAEEVLPNLEDEFGTITTKTIYQLLNLKVFNDRNTGETKIQYNSKGRKQIFPNGSLVIIDEAGYVDNILWKHIESQLIGTKIKLVFLADYYQATPVRSGESPVFNSSIPCFTLTERFRYPTNSGIHLNSLMFEDVIAGNSPQTLVLDNTFQAVTRGEFKELIEDKMVNQTTDSKIIAYTNQQVVAYNDFVCEQLYGDTGFHEGQDVIANQFYVVGNTKIRNEQVMRIKEIQGTCNDYECDLINMKVSFGLKNVVIQVPANFAQFKTKLKELAANKRWHEYFNLSENVVDIRHSWAVTAHKAQGSTYDYAFIDYPDMLKIKGSTLFYRLMNVAITRPRLTTFICKD